MSRPLTIQAPRSIAASIIINDYKTSPVTLSDLSQMSSLKPNLQLVEEMAQVSEETCFNFVHFRNALKSHRFSCDDKIRQRLSSISDPKRQCPEFYANLVKAEDSRMRNLNFCINVLKGRDESRNLKEVHFLLMHCFYYYLFCIDWIT